MIKCRSIHLTVNIRFILTLKGSHEKYFKEAQNVDSEEIIEYKLKVLIFYSASRIQITP